MVVVIVAVRVVLKAANVVAKIVAAIAIAAMVVATAVIVIAIERSLYCTAWRFSIILTEEGLVNIDTYDST